MEKMLKDNHKTSDEKAYFIRNVNQIENPTEFFELIGKTKSSVKCTADGLNINDKIDISPLAYNEIGSASFNEKINEIANYSNIPEKVGEELEIEIPEEKRTEYKNRLDAIKNNGDLTPEQKKAATKNLVNEMAGKDLTDRFDKTWNTCQKKLDDTIEHMFNPEKGLNQGIEDPVQKQDFARLKELTIKKVNGTITEGEQLELDNKNKECARHRKEYLFRSTTAQTNTPEEKRAFKESISSFTGAKYERLCFRINVEEVKARIESIRGTDNLGGDIFNNMKTSDYDRLNRVLQECGSPDKQDKMLKAALTLAKEDAFRNDVKKPTDIASMIEAIKLEDVCIINFKIFLNKF